MGTNGNQPVEPDGEDTSDDFGSVIDVTDYEEKIFNK
jgi:hypothetical protein